MQIRNKYYPYPVIAYGNDSYDDSEFVSDANYAHDGIEHCEEQQRNWS